MIKTKCVIFYQFVSVLWGLVLHYSYYLTYNQKINCSDHCCNSDNPFYSVEQCCDNITTPACTEGIEPTTVSKYESTRHQGSKTPRNLFPLSSTYNRRSTTSLADVTTTKAVGETLTVTTISIISLVILAVLILAFLLFLFWIKWKKKSRDELLPHKQRIDNMNIELNKTNNTACVIKGPTMFNQTNIQNKTNSTIVYHKVYQMINQADVKSKTNNTTCTTTDTDYQKPRTDTNNLIDLTSSDSQNCHVQSDSQTSTMSRDLPINRSFENDERYPVNSKFLRHDDHFFRVTVKDKNGIGSGHYGKVFEGTVYLTDNPNVSVRVAIKYASEIDWEFCLKEEAKLLRKIGCHLNVVDFVDVKLEPSEHGNCALVTKFCEHGDLRSYINKTKLSLIVKERPNRIDGKIWLFDKELKKKEVEELLRDNVLSRSALVFYAFQIANGMRFISDKQIIHRDLALRNILLTKEHIVKITDFGLACIGCDEYSVKTAEKALPTRWLAPESLDENRSLFSLQSDVWSFAVTLWELFTLALSPSSDVDAPSDKSKFRTWLLNGNRFPPPAYANDEIKQLMDKCWATQRPARPTFKEILKILSTCLVKESYEFSNYIDKM